MHHKYSIFYNSQGSLISALPSTFLVLSCCLEESGPVRYLFCLGSRFYSPAFYHGLSQTCALKLTALLMTGSLSIWLYTSVCSLCLYCTYPGFSLWANPLYSVIIIRFVLLFITQKWSCQIYNNKIVPMHTNIYLYLILHTMTAYILHYIYRKFETYNGTGCCPAY